MDEEKLLAILSDEALEYQPDTGAFTWKTRPDHHFASKAIAARWNGRWAGEAAFTSVDPRGYLGGSFMGRGMAAHRMAWLLHYGCLPEGQIDHINGDKVDNRIANLREVSITENQRNAKRPSSNTSGVAGVYWAAPRNKWAAQICVDRRVIPLGRYECFDDAVTARKAAEARYGFHENHGRAA